MGDHLKYVIIKVGGLEVSILFNCVIDHSYCANPMNIVAAGFCSVQAEYDEVDSVGKLNVSCWGESVSLKVKSRGEADAAVILRDLERGNL